MSEQAKIRQLIQAIRRLPSDRPKTVPGKWYRTQKEHWLGWLSEYDGPGAYGRKGDDGRGAAFAYNHIVEYRMLLWLIDAAGVDRRLLREARAAVKPEASLQANAAAIRRIVPWGVVARALGVQES